MGIEAGLLAASVAATGVKMFEGKQAASERNKALDERLQQERVAEAHRSIQRLDRVKEITSHNIATAGARGTSPASGSMKAVNEKAYNRFDQDENADLLNLQYRANYVNKLQDINDEDSYINAFGDILNLGQDFARFNLNK